MRDRKGGLQQQQTLFRLLKIDSRRRGSFGRDGENRIDAAFDEPPVILPWIQRVGRQLESASSHYAAVTVAAVAAAPGENPADIAGEAEWAALPRGGDPKPNLGRLSAEFRAQPGLAVGQAGHPALRLHAGERGIGNRDPAFGGDVAFQAIPKLAQHQDPLRSLRTPEHNFFRDHPNREQPGGS